MNRLKAIWAAFMAWLVPKTLDRPLSIIEDDANNVSGRLLRTGGYTPGLNSGIDPDAPPLGTQASASKPVKLQQKPKAERRQRAKEIESLGELLDSLDETFASLKLPFSRTSWIPKPHIDGLRKMGVHVVHPAHQDGVSATSTVPAGRILPAMVCVGYGLSRYDTEEKVYPAIVCAIKENKLPAAVTNCSGQHYLFGFGLKFGKRSEQDKDQEMVWVSGYVTVRKDGSVYVHKELKSRVHNITPRNPSSRRKNGRTITYSDRSWAKAEIAQGYDKASNGEGERIIAETFAGAMTWWLKRDENWSVAVKKGVDRITFAVPKELTAKFFKDRIKVTNANGHTKKIIHHVSQHMRTTTDGVTTVKEHIRGLASFDWNGYSCRVTAPHFNGVLSTEFTISGTVFDDDLPATGWVESDKVGTILASMEG